MIARVPQDSIDGLLFFNLFISDTIVLSNYADHINLYAIGNDKEETKIFFIKDFQTVNIGFMRTI